MSARSDDIVAYAYAADIYCPACTVSELMARGLAAPAAADMDTEDVLDQIAGANAIDRDDERSFDSNEFPKVVFRDQIDSYDDHNRCGSCGEVFA